MVQIQVQTDVRLLDCLPPQIGVRGGDRASTIDLLLIQAKRVVQPVVHHRREVKVSDAICVSIPAPRSPEFREVNPILFIHPRQRLQVPGHRGRWENAEAVVDAEARRTVPTNCSRKAPRITKRIVHPHEVRDKRAFADATAGRRGLLGRIQAVVEVRLGRIV